MTDSQAPLIFEVLVHTMEFFVVVGIASSVYFVKRSKRIRNERRNSKQG
jgi:Ca2+/Na+ antiporter